MSYDLFLSYNRADAAVVREIREYLARRGVRTFVDWNDLNPGQPWPQELERALQKSHAVAVFVGRSGYGPWQQREIHYALDLQTKAGRAFPVIPVILKGAELPAGFLALHTWVDLRKGLDDVAIEPLVRAIETPSFAARLPADISPYRRLDAFREEDAALFFGRDASIEAIVSRIDESAGWLDRPRLVTVTGPSGSGKSSVVRAGVLPRLRSRRPPLRVWDAAVMQPRKHPIHALASACVPLLDSELSEVERITAAASLAKTMRGEAGIVATVTRVLEKSRGTDCLLLIIDQFEEIFTQASPHVARDFVRQLLNAATNVPLSILLTLRSDYYGKAIALDRDLSDALPRLQVNVGSMRRDELREIIERPALIAGLAFEPGLVERILEDVGKEPGNLPLLEYALSELWDLRAEGRLTFAAYQEIGGVSGALTRRAETVYRELPEPEKEAAKRLLLRLVRVSPADEEGADTRRRARRGELAEEEWKLVDSFAGERARLVVSSKDPLSGEDGVEVAHEALIRRWDRFREWLKEDRGFLLWRQELAIYMGSLPSLPQGPLLNTAEKWLRRRGEEFNAAERRFIADSVTAAARVRKVWSFVAAAAVAMLGIWWIWRAYTRTEIYTVAAILAKNPETEVLRPAFRDEEAKQAVDRMVNLIRLGRDEYILRTIHNQIAKSERAALLVRLAVAMHGVRPDRVDAVLGDAVKLARESTAAPAERAAVLALIADAALRTGKSTMAVALLEEAEPALADQTAEQRFVADIWARAGRRDRARRLLVQALAYSRWDDPAQFPAAADLVRIGRAEDQHTIWSAFDRVPLPGDANKRGRVAAALARAYAVHGEASPAMEVVQEASGTWRDEALKDVAVELARRGNMEWAAIALRDIDSADVRIALLDGVLRELIRRNQLGEATRLIAKAPLRESVRAKARAGYVQHLLEVGRVNDAAAEAGLIESDVRLAEEQLKSDSANLVNPVPVTHARLAEVFARTGNRNEAERRVALAATGMAVLKTELQRDEVNAARAPALAALGRFHEGRMVADGIENDALQWDAYFAILDVYASKTPARTPPPSSRE